jgi:hypothetical protein
MAGLDELGERTQRALGERYTLERQVGIGGTSVVYAARDSRAEHSVALKVLKPEFAASTTANRFQREILLSAALRHPNIVPVLDSGIADTLLYLVMPLLEQPSLRDRLRAEKALPLEDALRIARDVAGALGHAHGCGIIHRDVKPANILLVDGTPLVTDFGIARITLPEGDTDLTASGVAVGTPEYMSPEQVNGSRDLDARSDVYALGCVLYEMLVGEPPFVGRTTQAVMARQRHDAPVAPSAMRPTIPPNVDAAVLRALAKSPVDRFASMKEFIEALDRPADRPVRPARVVRRRVAVGVIAALVAFGAFVVLKGGASELDPNRVVIFPLREQALPPGEQGMGEAVSTFIGYALESAEPLKWVNGADYLLEAERTAKAVPSTDRLRQVARRARAGYFIEGAIGRDGDSATTLLTLHGVANDTVIRSGRAAAALAGVSFPKVGLRAVGQVLPALLARGRRLDLSVLADRDAVAIAHFLAGERAYRAMHFREASEHFRLAVEKDSAFALAALRGALASSWSERVDTARMFVRAALAGSRSLAPKYALLARGTALYLNGRAAPAIASFDSAVARDSSMADAWMGLAESYYHLVPAVVASDSLAKRAYGEVVARDSTFTPALFHLAQIGLLEGDRRWADAFTRLAVLEHSDSSLVRTVALTRQCTTSPDRVSWNSIAASDPSLALIVVKWLTSGRSRSSCVERGFRAILAQQRATQRWGALLGLSASMIGEGRADDAVQLLRSPDVAQLPGWSLVLLASAIEGKALTGADSTVAALGTGYDAMRSSWLWLLLNWHTMRGDSGELRLLRNALATRRDTSRSRADSQFARTADARLSLARRDTTTAERLLRSLEPNASRGDLTWQPWEALAGERLLLAEILLARGRAAEAAAIASYLDAPEPIVHVMYRRKSLDLRIRAALARNDHREAARLRERLSALTSLGRKS